MQIIRNLPGPLLILLGATSLSFGGTIVKSFEGANLWQILFWRSIFFLIIISLFLFFTYRKNFFKSFRDSGVPGFVAGFFLSFGFAGYVFAMYNTTVANTNFVISTQTIFLAIFGYIFLKEKVNPLTMICIFLAMLGVLIMVGPDLEMGKFSERMLGNLVAFAMPITFSILIIIVRKYPNVDMVPSQFIAGCFAIFYGYLACEFYFSGKLIISIHDIFLGFLAGFFQLGFGFIFITVGAQKTPAVMVGIIALAESVLGPFWAWLIIKEIPSLSVLIGGALIIFAVLLQFYSKFKKVNKIMN